MYGTDPARQPSGGCRGCRPVGEGGWEKKMGGGAFVRGESSSNTVLDGGYIVASALILFFSTSLLKIYVNVICTN